MTRKRSYRIGRSLVPWTACAALFAYAAGGTAVAQDAATGYAEVLADVDRYGQYNTQLERLVESQEADIASLTAQIAGLEGTAAAMQPLLDKMFASLDQFVAGDLPFLMEERSARMDTLRLLMAEEGALSEKFRRLLEAYQIEIEYGRTMNAYPGKLDDGREVFFVHLGRVSLMYRTTDGEETAYWDADAGGWVVDGDYTRAVEEALEMAEEAVAPDLVTLPVPAARESSS
ncbi:MAG: DUF3450 domain-containing protein [Woeseia sp.]